MTRDSFPLRCYLFYIAILLSLLQVASGAAAGSNDTVTISPSTLSAYAIRDGTASLRLQFPSAATCDRFCFVRSRGGQVWAEYIVLHVRSAASLTDDTDVLPFGAYANSATLCPDTGPTLMTPAPATPATTPAATTTTAAPTAVRDYPDRNFATTWSVRFSDTVSGNTVDVSACLTALDDNTVLLSFRAVPEFDIWVDEVVDVVVSMQLLPYYVMGNGSDASTGGLSLLGSDSGSYDGWIAASPIRPIVVGAFTITPPNTSTTVVASVGTAALVALHAATVVVLPLTIDTGGLLASTMSTCTYTDARTWLPLGYFGVIVTGGETNTQRAWHVALFVFIGAALVSGWMIVRSLWCAPAATPVAAADGEPRATEEAATKQRLLEEVRLSFRTSLMSVVLYFVPGFCVTGGALLAGGFPLLQVAGVVMLASIAAAVYAVFKQALHDPRVLFLDAPPSVSGQTAAHEELADPATPLWRQAWLRATLVDGFWYDPSLERVRSATDMRLHREVRGGTPTRARRVLALWCVTMIALIMSGVGAELPMTCLLMRVIAAVLWVISGLLALRLQVMRAPILTYATFAIRLATAGAIIVQGFGPSLAKVIVFVICAIVAFVIGALRLLFALRVMKEETKGRVLRFMRQRQDATERALRAIKEEEERQRREEEVQRRRAEAERFARKRRELKVHGPSLLECVIGDAATFTAAIGEAVGTDRGSSIAGAVVAQVAGEDAFDENEPAYIRDASRLPLNSGVPIPPPEGLTRRRRLQWFPTERPHVRTTNEGDQPLRARPYRVRAIDEYEEAYDDDAL